jgi:hypothetical protein
LLGSGPFEFATRFAACRAAIPGFEDLLIFRFHGVALHWGGARQSDPEFLENGV